MACLKSPWQLLKAVALVSAVLAAVMLTTMAHPYLLADNRHVPFYVWRWLLRHEQVHFSRRVSPQSVDVERACLQSFAVASLSLTDALFFTDPTSLVSPLRRRLCAPQQDAAGVTRGTVASTILGGNSSHACARACEAVFRRLRGHRQKV